MIQLKHDTGLQAHPGPVYTPTADAKALLNHLRFTALQCRAKPSTELFKACALLQTTPRSDRDAYADALMRCLGQALGHKPKLFAPNVDEVTFDEQWLMQLANACVTRDEDSRAFLLRSRVAPESIRLINFLISRVSDSFYTN